MRTYLIGVIVALVVSSAFALPVVARDTSYSDYIEQYCDDMLALRRCGTFQPVAVKVQKQAKALLARFVTMQDSENEIEDFLPRLEEQFQISDNRVIKFAAAYYIVYLETYLDQNHGSSSDDALFASLFDDLDVNFLDARTSYSRPIEPVVRIRDSYSDDTDSLSRGTYRERALSIRNITQTEGGSIEKLRSDQTDVRISKKTITKQRDLLQLMIRAEDENGRPATDKKGYRMVAVLDDGGDDIVTAMRFDSADNEWYFARAIDTQRYDQISFYLLCENCGGDTFGYPGTYRNREVADEVTYQLDTDDRYNSNNEYCYDSNDRRYRCDDDYDSRNNRNYKRYCYDRYDNRYICDDDYNNRNDNRYDQLDLNRLTASPERPGGDYQVTTSLSFTNNSNRSLIINAQDFAFSLRGYKEGGTIHYNSMSNTLNCGNTSSSQITVSRGQSCTLQTTFYGVSGRENEQLFVQVQYQGNGYHSNSIATQTIWPTYQQPLPVQPVQPQPIQQPVPFPCPNLSTAVGSWQAATLPGYAHCYRQGYPGNLIPLPNPRQAYDNLIPLPNPLDPDYGGPFEIYTKPL